MRAPLKTAVASWVPLLNIDIIIIIIIIIIITFLASFPSLPILPFSHIVGKYSIRLLNLMLCQEMICCLVAMVISLPFRGLLLASHSPYAAPSL